MKIWDLDDLMAVELPMTTTPDGNRQVIDYAKLTDDQHLIVGLRASVHCFLQGVADGATFGDSMFIEGAIRTPAGKVKAHAGVGVGSDWQKFVDYTSIETGKLSTAFLYRRPSGKAVSDGLLKRDNDNPATWNGADFEEVSHPVSKTAWNKVQVGFAGSGDKGWVDFEASSAGCAATMRSWKLQRELQDAEAETGANSSADAATELTTFPGHAAAHGM